MEKKYPENYSEKILKNPGFFPNTLKPQIIYFVLVILHFSDCVEVETENMPYTLRSL